MQSQGFDNWQMKGCKQIIDKLVSFTAQEVCDRAREEAVQGTESELLDRIRPVQTNGTGAS